MDPEIDASNGNESLTLDQAAAAYSKAIAPKEADTGQSDDAGQDDSEQTDETELASEDAGEGTDGETEDEGQAEDGEETDEEPDSEKGRYVAHNGRVKLPDGSESTIADLIQGNLRDRDYRQKTMEAAEVKKTYTAQSDALKASETQLQQQMEYTASLVKSIIGTPPDPALADPNSPNYDPAKYQADEVRFRSWAQHLTYLEQEQQRIGSERQAKTETDSKDRLSKEWGLALEKLPELKDQKKLESFGKDTLKYGAEYGYTPQELANIHSDHRNLVVMKKAIAWDKLQASKANVQKKVEGRPPVQRGGKRLSPNDARARSASDAITRAQKSGSLDDVTAAYLASTSRKG